MNRTVQNAANLMYTALGYGTTHPAGRIAHRIDELRAAAQDHDIFVDTNRLVAAPLKSSNFKVEVRPGADLTVSAVENVVGRKLGEIYTSV